MVALSSRRHALTVALALVAAIISLLAVASMAATVYLAVTARNDAQAINQAGSLRMQVWRLVALASEADAVQWRHDLAAVEATYRRLAATRLLADPAEPQTRRLRALHQQWQDELFPALASARAAQQVSTTRIAAHVAALDAMVGLLQDAAERRLKRLKWLQLMLLTLTLPLIAYGSYCLMSHVLFPLRRLIQVVEALRAGRLEARSHYRRDDEIGLLAATLDDMASQLDRLYRSLELEVEDKSQRLEQSHLALRLLYANARYLAATAPEEIDYARALAPFSALLAPVTLALLPAGATRPDAHRLLFTLRDSHADYGTLVASLPDAAPLPAWKRQICETVADHLRAAMALRAHSLQQRRLALMDERAVIARELHDSLAQSLSYLNIQALRLQRRLGADDTGLGELRQGIDHAYRQLRELLVTFRLRLTENGVNDAVTATVSEFAERGGLAIDTDLTLADGLLAPDEELHLVQILREALANVVQHAHARHVGIALHHSDDCVMLRVEDDGVGLPADLNRPCHYGTIIMQERAHSLNGTLNLASRPEGGTCVTLTFTPRGGQHAP